MATCPNGHASSSSDYCDECGAPIGAPLTPPPSTGPATPVAAQGTGEPCPECGTPRDGRFCEVCGRDFLTGSPTQTNLAAPDGGSGAPWSPGLDPAAGNGSSGQVAVAGGPAGASGGTAGSTAGGGAGGTGPDGGSGLPSRLGGPEWRVLVTADRAYHARMASASMPDAQPIAFPAFCPDRRFALSGGQVLVGRRSRSRGIEPQIDLTGPPEDAGVSHAHALLVAGADGSWSVVDLDSANGTYLNESADPIEANVPVPLADGDRVHLGAWTTLTVQAG
jgi:hypothetical protein